MKNSIKMLGIFLLFSSTAVLASNDAAQIQVVNQTPCDIYFTCSGAGCEGDGFDVAPYAQSSYDVGYWEDNNIAGTISMNYEQNQNENTIKMCQNAGISFMYTGHEKTKTITSNGKEIIKNFLLNYHYNQKDSKLVVTVQPRLGS